MLFENLVTVIEKTAPISAQANWDKSGTQVAASRANVFHLAVFLDATPRNVREALARGADCLLSHHPLALKPELPSRINAYHETLRLCLCANTPLYAAHTSLDVNLEGPSGWFGRALGLENARILEPVAPDLGYGQVGDLPRPMPWTELWATISRLLKIEWASLAGAPAGIMRRVAWCGGSGGSLLDMAADAGADLFVTGDIKYHAALEARLPVLDVGHHSLEEEMMRIFSSLLREELAETGVEVTFIPSKSPFKMERIQGCLEK